MSPVLVFSLLALCAAALAKKEYAEPEYLDMLRATGQDEEFARLLGIDVNLVRPQEGRSEEDFIFNQVSDLGDILLSPEQEEQARQGMRFSRNPRYRWPGNEIPYTIGAFDFTRQQKETIERAIAAFNRRTRFLKIVPRNGQQDYVHVISGNGCYSYLGRIGGRQTLSLQRNGCLRSGTIQHEFIHAAGFTHEHNRPDRDNHVTVLWDNIRSEWRSQYEKESDEHFEDILEYDHLSVMHYPLAAPGSSKPAFEVLNPAVEPESLGQRTEATDTDIRKVDYLYSS